MDRVIKDEVVRLESFTRIGIFDVRICFRYQSPKNYKPKNVKRAQWLLRAARKRMKAVA